MKRIILTDAQRNRFRDLAQQTYNAIGPDSGWEQPPHYKMPSKAVFVYVITDQMHTQQIMTKEEAALWSSLSNAEQRRIILSVGP